MESYLLYKRATQEIYNHVYSEIHSTLILREVLSLEDTKYELFVLKQKCWKT
jgi:hypothetical protein